ncbi:Nitrogen permease regulator 2 [Elasticomyces elasticus]|uniref:Nitrogen permease regulator 2 n=1 Tax=Exophiala sideris TaxID=1016849 RepID=A0ABR0JFT5_9EURO|nr:Nitrogen permease regulator 2 [Elasticomyces elasticus]KAK5025694.1 Nitrogen permease regulator 2 [Exophiala sideris]KAK5033097.1 Nitrogen permease regulator 2 [Exophiala sideris]KAK5063582.1 Nitrogen permease regulator 2 [Exophiala sideris]KAK5180585.1 Nitrogen permease regulator 2 [Eurotiomycetes sp. CCFEE 6388]
MSIKAIFYSKFDPQEGPKILHQVPEDSILTTSELSASNGPTSSSASSPLLSFSTISRFLIPRQSLCGNLISLSPPPLTPNTPPTLVLSHPICLTSPHYPRNEFIFNFALVLGEPSTTDVTSYKSVVKKLAHLMRSLEEQSRFLSDDTAPPNSGKIYSLCEMLMEDLNNYCECMIPIDELNTLNIKLFPTLPNPASVKPWHVPLFTVRIETMVDENWDLTLLRIIPYINGVNSVKRIAMLADADVKLTKKCIKHLLFYGCVLLLDIFGFNAIYAPTAEFSNMIAKDIEMQKECARYVNTAFAPSTQEEAIIDSATDRRTSGLTTATLQDEDIWPLTGKGDPIDGVGIVQLFANLRQGQTVREWYVQNTNMLANIDMRRFITFGVIKGFLYRVHRYAIRTNKGNATHGHHAENGTEHLTKSMSSERNLTEEASRAQKKHSRDAYGKGDSTRHLNARIIEFLDGTHCFDEICTELEISEKELIDRLKSRDIGEAVIICR